MNYVTNLVFVEFQSQSVRVRDEQVQVLLRLEPGGVLPNGDALEPPQTPHRGLHGHVLHRRCDNLAHAQLGSAAGAGTRSLSSNDKFY